MSETYANFITRLPHFHLLHLEFGPLGDVSLTFSLSSTRVTCARLAIFSPRDPYLPSRRPLAVAGGSVYARVHDGHSFCGVTNCHCASPLLTLTHSLRSAPPMAIPSALTVLHLDACVRVRGTLYVRQSDRRGRPPGRVRERMRVDETDGVLNHDNVVSD